MKVESIRTLTMRAKTEGFPEATAEANKLAGGMDNVAKSATGMAVVTDQSAKRQMSAAAAYKAQSMRLDETFRAQEKLNRETKIADSMLRQGGINEQQHAERIALITQRYTMASAATGKMADAMKPARYELINLSRQMQDVSVSLASGQSPFLVAIQQGTQMADIFASSNATMGSFFRTVVTGAGRFAVSAAGIATGIAAIAGGAVYMAASWVSGQKDIEKALSGIGSRSLTTAKDINELAEINAKVSSMSISESREAALEFVKTGNIRKDNIIALTGLVDGFSKTIGKSSKEAASELAKIFSGDVITAAQKLDEVYGSASGQQLQYIRNLENAGQRQQAIAETTRVFNSTIKAAAEQTGFWAASWDAVANAASNAADAIGKALSKQTGVGQSQQERLAGLQKEFEMRQENARIRQDVREQRGLPGVGPEGAPGAGAIRKLLADIAEAEEKLGLGADNVAKQFGKMGDEAVRALVPTIEQLEKVDKLISDIQNAQTQGKGSALADAFNEALNAAEMLKDKLQQTRDETARANANGLQLKETYQTTTVEAARTLDALKNQATVAAAVGGAARMAAQEQARFNQLMREGKDAEDAARIAAAERLVTQEQISSQVKEQALLLNQQTELIGKSREEAAALKAEFAYINAIRAGASQSAASELSAAVEANESAKIAVQLSNERARANANAARAADAEAAALARVLAADEALYNQMGFVPKLSYDLRTSVALQQRPGGGYTQFDPGGYESKTTAASQATQLAAWTYGPGGFDPVTGNPNAQGIQYRFNQMYAGGGIGSAIGGLGVVSGGGLYGGTPFLDPNKVSMLTRAIDVLPKEQQANALQQLLGQVRAAPQGLERDETVKQLMDKLEQLAQATDANTSATQAMTDVLSPYYSTDPRQTHLGFRAFAGGGIMTQFGELPLKQYQGGGMATSPQVAVFGERSVPEAYVPVPSGRIPVELRSPANSNQRPVNVTINVMGNADAGTVAALKQTGFQKAQQLRRVTG